MKKNIFYIILGLIVTFVYYRWFLLFDIIAHGDWGYLVNLIGGHFDIFTRRSVFSRGSILLDMSQFSWFFYGFLGRLGFDYPIAERVIFLRPCILLSVTGFYRLGKYVFKSDIAGFFTSVVFCFNTYILTLQTGHITLMTAFSIFPWVFLAYEQFLLTGKLKNILYTILLFLLSFGYEPRSAYIIAIVLILYTMFTLLKGRKINVGVGVIGIAIMILCNVWRYLPLSHSLGDISNNEIFNRGLFGSGFFNLLYSLTLHHPFWSGGQIMVFKNQIIPLYFWLIPMSAFCGFMTNRKNSYMYFFAFISLLGIFLSKQSAPPFVGIYQWLYDHFPGFNAFREASKFYFLVAIGYSVMIGGFIDWIWKYSKINKHIRCLSVGLIALIFLWNTKPIFTGEIGSLFIGRHMPQDYSILNKFLDTTSVYGRTMSIPGSSRWMLYSNKLPKLSLVDELGGTYKDTGYTGKNTLDQIDSFIAMTGADYLLDTSSIRYIVLPMVDFENDDDFFADYGDPYDDPRNNSKLSLDQVKQQSRVRSLKLYAKYYSILKNASYLHEINIGTKDVKIFENKNYTPLISTASQTTYRFINPTKYYISLNISRDSTGQELKFLQSMHPERKLYPGKVTDTECTNAVVASGWSEYSDISGFTTYITKSGDTIDKVQELYQLTGSELIIYNPKVPGLGYRRYDSLLESGIKLNISRSFNNVLGGISIECIGSGATFFEGDELRYIRQQPLRDDTHKMIYDYANGWTVDLNTGAIDASLRSAGRTMLDQGLQEGWIVQNPDGSYTVSLTLYFRPQSWFYVGLMISGATLVIVLGLLLRETFNNRRTLIKSDEDIL